MINSRVNNAGIRYKNISNDHGKTWTTTSDSALIDPGCNASIMNYSFINNTIEENWIVFANAYDNKNRENLTISLSCDNG